MRGIVERTSISTKTIISNHSGRKTLVRKLKAAKITESSIIKVTGHTSTRGLRNYDPGDQEEFLQMSHAISKTISCAFSNCNVTINKINRQTITTNISKRRRVIYSSESENSQEN